MYKDFALGRSQEGLCCVVMRGVGILPPYTGGLPKFKIFWLVSIFKISLSKCKLRYQLTEEDCNQLVFSRDVKMIANCSLTKQLKQILVVTGEGQFPIFPPGFGLSLMTFYW